MRFRTLLMLLFCSVSLFAQKNLGTLSGTVIEKGTNEPLMYAVLKLFSLPDSTLRVSDATDSDGKFALKADPAKYFLQVSYVGCVTKEFEVKVEKKKVVDLGRIELEEDAILLEKAVITAEVPPVTASEDTLVYNTAAFRVPAGSMLEELIKKYPGVDIAEDGTIKINGKTVNRILMKGKDFFGTDKDMALKNISVDAVDKVKFYDKKSDYARITGIDDGEEETVLDLQMKKGVSDGFFSNTDAGYGFDYKSQHLYLLRNTTSYYNDDSQYTLVLSANNIGDQGFSDGRGRGFRGGGGGGLSAPKRAGFNFAHETRTLELGGNVRANHVSNDVRNWTSTETFMPQVGKNQFSNSRSNSLSSSLSFNADMRLEWKPDTMTNIIFSPSFGYSSSDSWSESISATFGENPFDYIKGYGKDVYGEVFDTLKSIAINNNKNESLGLSQNMNARARVQVNRRLDKPGRNITFNGNFSYSHSKSENFSTSDVTYYQASAGSDGYYQKRFSSTPSENWNQPSSIQEKNSTKTKAISLMILPM